MTGDGWLVMQLVDNGVVRSHDGPGGWQVTVIECPNGLANVESRRGVTQVFVADLPVAGMNDPNRFAAAACTPEGDALVVARQAPLPLLVTPEGQRAAPAHPDRDELLHLAEGDRLVILSASALEAMASSVRTLLRGPTEFLLKRDPIELLTDLVDGAGAGSGAIICRHSRALQSVQEAVGEGCL